MSKRAVLVGSSAQHSAWAWNTGSKLYKDIDLATDASDIINLYDFVEVAAEWLDNDMWPVWVGPTE